MPTHWAFLLLVYSSSKSGRKGEKKNQTSKSAVCKTIPVHVPKGLRESHALSHAASPAAGNGHPPRQKSELKRNRHPHEEERPGPTAPLDPGGAAAKLAAPRAPRDAPDGLPPPKSGEWAETGSHSPCQAGSTKGMGEDLEMLYPRGVTTSPSRRQGVHDHFKGRFLQARE